MPENVQLTCSMSVMNTTYHFEEEPFEFDPEYEQEEENEFDPENFDSELTDSEWEEEVQRGQSPAAAKRSDNSVRRCPPFEFACDMTHPR